MINTTLIDSSNDIVLSPFQEEHIAPILELMNREGWYYYDRNELMRYLKLGEECFVLLSGKNVIGCLFTTNYGNQAWLGNIIVAGAPEAAQRSSDSIGYRNRGYAGRMILHAMEILGKKGVKTFRLGSVPTAIGAYKKVGFRAESFTTAQEAWLPLTFRDDPPELEPGEVVETMTAEDVTQGVAQLDGTYFRSNRTTLLQELYADSIRESCLCLRKKDDLLGFVMIRRRMTLKKEGGFAEGPDAVYRLGPCCIQPDVGIRGFKILFQKAMKAVHAELEHFEGQAKLYVVFPQNAVKSRIYAAFEEMGGADPDRVFNEHDQLFGSTASTKNDELWKVMQELGFQQEYFEQVMSVTPGEPPECPPRDRVAVQSQADPEGIFATATPGDKA